MILLKQPTKIFSSVRKRKIMNASQKRSHVSRLADPTGVGLVDLYDAYFFGGMLSTICSEYSMCIEIVKYTQENPTWYTNYDNMYYIPFVYPFSKTKKYRTVGGVKCQTDTNLCSLLKFERELIGVMVDIYDKLHETISTDELKNCLLLEIFNQTPDGLAIAPTKKKVTFAVSPEKIVPKKKVPKRRPQKQLRYEDVEKRKQEVAKERGDKRELAKIKYPELFAVSPGLTREQKKEIILKSGKTEFLELLSPPINEDESEDD